jgi:hypothetical protein
MPAPGSADGRDRFLDLRHRTRRHGHRRASVRQRGGDAGTQPTPAASHEGDRVRQPCAHGRSQGEGMW